MHPLSRQDGTARHAEPGAGENLSCTVVFVMVYYFSIGKGWYGYVPDHILV